MNEQNEPLINFAGELVALGPLRRELIPLYQKWNNDFEVNRATSSARPVTFEEQEASYDHYVHDSSSVFFTIYERSTGRAIGLTYLSDIKPRSRSAEFAIVIGEKDYHNKGYGSEATRLMLDYAFTVLGLHNVLLKVFAFNQAAIRAYEKAGFREIGRRREIRWMDGRLWDDVYMDCLSTEFESPVLCKIFTADP